VIFTPKGTSLREPTSFEPFCVRSVRGKNPESHRASHRKDMSPLTQGLNYRSTCDYSFFVLSVFLQPVYFYRFTPTLPIINRGGAMRLFTSADEHHFDSLICWLAPPIQTNVPCLHWVAVAAKNQNGAHGLILNSPNGRMTSVYYQQHRPCTRLCSYPKGIFCAFLEYYKPLTHITETYREYWQYESPESRWRQKNLAMELVNIYRVLSCSFVEIMRLCVVSVCINKWRHCW